MGNNFSREMNQPVSKYSQFFTHPEDSASTTDNRFTKTNTELKLQGYSVKL